MGGSPGLIQDRIIPGIHVDDFELMGNGAANFMNDTPQGKHNLFLLW